GVTVMCQSTGLSAIGMTKPIGDDPGYPASAEILAKIAVASRRDQQPSEADERLRKMIPSPYYGYTYPSDFEDLGGSKGEHNYIAVVHADGNGVTDRIRQIGEQAKDPRDYLTRLRAFSDALKDAAATALKTTLQKIKVTDDKVVHPARPDLVISLSFDKETGERFLPFRPIVFGGDDVTFVCDGRLGLSLAIEYLQQFEDETSKRSECGGKLTACAGIAIVKSHYPFARAYALADELCKSAKNYHRKQNLDRSCLDWHFALSGLSGTIKEIREREYSVKSGLLTLRPVTVKDNPKEPQRAWDVVQKSLKDFQEDDTWTGRRNKVKALRDALREGPEAVERFRNMFPINKMPIKLPPLLAGYEDFEAKGWWGGFCGYFDAIELTDWFIPLNEG
ncbi:MAG: hypothetical protein MN733_36245, partial [Nitrososphaera sp.]|nr:hypothetical protein [Nitrososphaera sp.]